MIPNSINWGRYESDGHPIIHGEQKQPFPYILSVAAQYPHKNLETLIRAFARVQSQFPEFRLVLVGQLSRNLVGTSRQSRLEELVKEFELDQEVIVTGFVSDYELGRWYRNASLFVFPSLFEGFGMPPVEALGMGVPTLTTRCGSLLEVTMGLAQYVDNPLDPVEMAERIVDMLENQDHFRISEKAIQEIRKEYDVRSIGEKYYRVLCGS